MKKIFYIAAALLAFAGCVKDEQYPYAAIADLDYTYAYDASTTVDVTATVNSFAEILSAKLYYTAGSASEVALDMTQASAASNVYTYTATIPAFAMDTNVSYYMVFTTKAGDTTSATTKYTVGVTPPNYAAIKLNELNGNDKFIELYNTGGADVALEGMYIIKDNGETATWTADATLTLKAGEFLLLYSEDVTVAGGAREGYAENLTFHSGLSPKKAVRIQLFNPSGKSVDDFNLVDFQKKASASYSRVPDGTGTWCFTAATPGAANSTDDSDPVQGLQ